MGQDATVPSGVPSLAMGSVKAPELPLPSYVGTTEGRDVTPESTAITSPLPPPAQQHVTDHVIPSPSNSQSGNVVLTIGSDDNEGSNDSISYGNGGLFSLCNLL